MDALMVVIFCLLGAGFSVVVVAEFLLSKKMQLKIRVQAVVTVVISLFGGALIFLTLWQDISGVFKVFLIMAGAAPAAMIIGFFLHNGTCALIGKITGKKDIDEPVFFLLTLFGVPAAFLTGMVGSIAMFIRGLVFG